MIQQFGFSLLISVLASLAVASESQPLIKVLIRDNLRGALFKGKGLQITDSKGQSPILATTGSVYVTAKFRNFQIKDGATVHHLVTDTLNIKADHLTLDGTHIPQSIMVLPRQGTRLRVVAELEIENYLQGVVPSEMPSRWPIEALKAQAVASRSYAMATAQSRKNEDYHLEATVMHQVYSFSNWKNLAKTHQDKVSQALLATKGQFLTEAGASIPMKSYYHADCGGRTESAEVVWSYAGTSQGVLDRSCALRGKSEWSYQISRSEFLKSFKDVLDVDDVIVVGRSGSGRATKVLIRDRKNAKDQTYGLNEFRRQLGFSNLKSGLFDVAMSDDSIRFKGRGFGHGVGLCQTGTRALAASGESYVDILKRYFPTAEIKNVKVEPVITAQHDKDDDKQEVTTL